MRYPRRTPAIASASALTALLALAPGRVPGQIVLDGTTGAAGPLTGPSFTIPNTSGTQVGSNLFHSFSDFNVRTGESATFTSGFTGTTQNIIARVTGPSVSQIDGRIASTVPGASLWLVNPNGVVLGAGASLDVQGSFYATTADALLLPGGGRFDATNAAGSTLTVGDPVAFGFLDTTMGSIAVSGTTLAVPAGRTLGVVGGTIDATSATLSAPAGHVVLASAAGLGNIPVQPGTTIASPVTQLGTITLDAATVATTADGGGGGGGDGGSVAVTPDVYILGDQFMMRSASRIATNTSTTATATGDVWISVAEGTLLDGSEIRTGTSGATRGGRVTIEVETLHMANAQIASESTAVGGGAGAAGEIVIGGPDFLVIEFFADSFADVVELVRSARISASTIDGAGGLVGVNAATMRIDGGSAISAATTGAGRGGDIVLAADTVELTNGGMITLSTAQFGKAGVLRFLVRTGLRPSVDPSSRISFESPQITGSVLPLAAPAPATAGLFAENCVPRLARQRSTLTVQSRGAGLAPTDYLRSPVPLAADPSPAVAQRFGLPQLLAVQAAGCRG